ncbi:MAG: hypothetical protein V1701_12920 [Planctomycetota bacterium]
MNTFYLNICNIEARVGLTCSPTFFTAVKDRYQEFISDSSSNPPGIDLNIRVNNQDNLPDVPKPEVTSSDNKLDIKGHAYETTLQRRNNLWTGNANVQENIYTLDTLLRILWAQLLPERNGFLIHACGLIYKGEGFLFPGKSSSGKTTLARKAGRDNTLSDELVGVQITTDGHRIMGTPFWGEFQKGGNPINCPLQSIYFLQKAKTVSIQRLSVQDSVKSMLRLILFFGIDTNRVNQLLNLAKQCAETLPGFNICLAKNTNFESIMDLIEDQNAVIA